MPVLKALPPDSVSLQQGSRPLPPLRWMRTVPLRRRLAYRDRVLRVLQTSEGAVALGTPLRALSAGHAKLGAAEVLSDWEAPPG